MGVAIASQRTGLAVERLAATPALRRRWSELALASENVYLTPEWIETWTRHFGRDGELLLYGARMDGELVAIVPLYLERRRGLRLLRFAGHELADRPGVVAASADRALARATLAAALDRARVAWDVLVCDRQPPGERPYPGAATRVRERYADYSARLDEGWDAYYASLSGRLRRKLARDERELAARGARLVVLDLDRDLEATIDALLDLHETRWPQGSRFTAGFRRAFQVEILTTAAERGWLRVRAIDAAGRLLAFGTSFRFGSREHSYMCGRRIGYDGVTLGDAVTAFELREAAAAGVDEYRFAYGFQEHKRRFANRVEGVETTATARTLRGRIAVAAEARLRRADPGHRAAARPAGALG